MQGRKPMPTEMAVRIGKMSRAEADSVPEPQPEKGLLKCPDHLGDEARAEWDRIVPVMEACGVLTQADIGAVAAYCSAYGRWVKAENELDKTGLIIRSPKGYPIQSPYLSIVNKAIEQMNKLGTGLGLDPASRVRLRGAGGVKKKESKVGLGKFTKPRLVS